MSLICPKCGRSMNTRMVASTSACEVGLVRRRICDCGATVSSIERVLGADLEGCLLVEGLDRGTGRGRGPGSDLSIVRQLVRRLGGTVTNLRA